VRVREPGQGGGEPQRLGAGLMTRGRRVKSS